MPSGFGIASRARRPGAFPSLVRESLVVNPDYSLRRSNLTLPTLWGDCSVLAQHFDKQTPFRLPYVLNDRRVPEAQT